MRSEGADISMVTLRDLSRTDRAIASITSDECHLIASVLDIVVVLCHSWIFKYLIPKALRDKTLAMRMLAATLSRTPEERQPLGEQIRLAMDKDRG